MRRPLLCGIYRIVNTKNGMCYVGQSTDLLKRKQTHFSSLGKNEHKNKYLQNAFNLYGEENFEFEIVELCSRNELDDKEEAYVDKFHSLVPHGYNLTAGGKGNKKWAPPKSVIKSNSKKVVLLNDGTVFDSIKDAADFFHVDASSITMCIRGKTSYGGKFNGGPLVWCDYDEYMKNGWDDEFAFNRIKRATNMYGYIGINDSSKKKVVCLNNRMIFDSMADAARWCGSNSTINISDAARGKTDRAFRDSSGEWLAWALYDDFVNMTSEDIEERIRIANIPIRQVRARPVICLTTGETFPSAQEASRQTGVCQSSITMCCLGRLKHAGRSKDSQYRLEWRYAV